MDVINTDKLKRLAEDILIKRSMTEFHIGVIYPESAEAILDLIAERDEAVTLLRRLDGYDFAGSPVEDQIVGFLARIKEV